MNVAPSRFADQALSHLGEDGPLNTCWSNGPERWARELGLPGLNTGSVSQAEQSARAGVNGWRYHAGTDGIAPGHIADWKPQYLGPTATNPNPRHVTAVVEVRGDQWRGVGSGTPSGKVAKQPAGGGLNPLSVLDGYFVPPTVTSAAQAPSKPASKPKPVDDDDDRAVYLIRKGDYLQRIAKRHDTSVRAILAANPSSRDGRSRDFHIARANHIEAGQRIYLP